MGFHPFSFLLGLGAAAVLPLVTRVFRPLAVEAAAAGMGFFEDARRVVAEQLETLEDIAAEARARREEIVAAGNGHAADDESGVEGDEAVAPVRRRRANGSARRRAS